MTLFLLFVFLLLISCVLLVVSTGRQYATLLICWDILRRSRNKTTFAQWARMVREHPSLTCIDHSTSPPVDIPSEPHFVLTNHIASHHRLGSVMGMAFIAATQGCRIVCFADYNKIMQRIPRWFAADTMNQILYDDIAIDKDGLDNHQKEQLLVRSIRETFARGENVLWFIDDGVGKMVMRSLTKKVLGHFPDTNKQLVHLREPTDSHTFGYRRYTATKDLDRIIELRTQIMAAKGSI